MAIYYSIRLIDRTGVLITLLVVPPLICLAGFLPLISHIDPNWDLHTWQSLVIELTVGGLAGTIIAYKIHWNDVKKKEERGKTFTYVLLDYMIPLRQTVQEFIKTIEKEGENSYRMFQPSTVEYYKKWYNNIRDYRLRINPLLLVSGDSINATHQLMLTHIMNILEMEMPKDIMFDVLVYLYQIESGITNYLKSNKERVEEAVHFKNMPNEERLKEFRKPHLTFIEEEQKKIYEKLIEINNELVKDILSD